MISNYLLQQYTAAVVRSETGGEKIVIFLRKRGMCSQSVRCAQSDKGRRYIRDLSGRTHYDPLKGGTYCCGLHVCLSARLLDFLASCPPRSCRLREYSSDFYKPGPCSMDECAVSREASFVVHCLELAAVGCRCCCVFSRPGAVRLGCGGISFFFLRTHTTYFMPGATAVCTKHSCLNYRSTTVHVIT